MSAKGSILGTVGAIGGFLVGGPAGAVALGSMGYQAGAGSDAADAGVKAAKQNRDLMNAQASEVERRAGENSRIIMGKAETAKGEQIGSIVRGGVDVSSASALVALENSHANYQRQAYMQERDAGLQAKALRDQAQMQVDQAKRAKQASDIGIVTSALGGAATMYMNSPAQGGGGGNTGGSSNGTFSYKSAGPGNQNMIAMP